MNRQELLEALAAAEAEAASREVWRFGPDGFGPYPPDPRPPAPAPPTKRARPRKNSKQGRRERGGIV